MSPNWTCLYRHTEELEQGSVAMQAEARKLQREANSLACTLEAVMHVKHKPRTSFNAATPIDKTLEYLQNVLMVSSLHHAVVHIAQHYIVWWLLHQHITCG